MSAYAIIGGVLGIALAMPVFLPRYRTQRWLTIGIGVPLLFLGLILAIAFLMPGY